jgi:hypothetical protein
VALEGLRRAEQQLGNVGNGNSSLSWQLFNAAIPGWQRNQRNREGCQQGFYKTMSQHMRLIL